MRAFTNIQRVSKSMCLMGDGDGIGRRTGAVDRPSNGDLGGSERGDGAMNMGEITGQTNLIGLERKDKNHIYPHP